MDTYDELIPREGAAWRIAKDLRMKIILHHFAPGERLIEMNLTEQYSVSRTTVRTVLQSLESEGMIRFLPNGGKEVVGFSGQYANDLYDLREMLECRALEYCIEGNPDYAPMLSILTRIDEASEKRYARGADYFAELDMDYHRAIVRMSRNYPLMRSWETTAPLMRALLDLNSDEDYRERYIREFYTKHREILDLIIQKKPCVLDRMRVHIRDARDMSLRHLSVLWDR